MRSQMERDMIPDRFDLSQRNLYACPLFMFEERLKMLTLQNNYINRIENLNHLLELVYLDLSNNRLEVHKIRLNLFIYIYIDN